tara:strand:- start:813 stop:1049 length:237 start_codon:yes stop_codon:yes gene_type:complete
MKAIHLLERVLNVFTNLNSIIPMKEIYELKKEIELFLDDFYRNSNICESEYEELDERVRVIEGFLETIETITDQKELQ